MHLPRAKVHLIAPNRVCEPHTRDLDPLQIDVVLALHSGFLLHRAASFGPSVDRNLATMMTALGLASVDWLRRRR